MIATLADTDVGAARCSAEAAVASTDEQMMVVARAALELAASRAALGELDAAEAALAQARAALAERVDAGAVAAEAARANLARPAKKALAEHGQVASARDLPQTRRAHPRGGDRSRAGARAARSTGSSRRPDWSTMDG